ncbi:MAG: pyruvate ferredoxin oxidoreductase [Elusimicrobiota bacterium]
MKQFLEGAIAIARTVKLTKPGVISAYPITPQTHIVEELAQLVADGELKSEFVNVESEHSAASVVLGASASGVRAYTSTSSQGLLLMAEVVFNIAGMRLPLVMCCVNRAISAPINIWNDHQDSMAVRDSGWFQFFAENVQEAVDLHVFGCRLSEDNRVLLPVMVCIDGYILSHGYEVVDLPEQEQVDSFLRPYNLPFKLDVEKPLTLGVLASPDFYTETRYAIQETMASAEGVMQELAGEFKKVFSREIKFVETYKLEGASKAIIAMGSICGTIKEAIDDMQKDGIKVGLVKIVGYRPFPEKELMRALKGIPEIAVVDKSISLGSKSPLFLEIRSLFQGQAPAPKISGFVMGLGGRDISKADISGIVEMLSKEQSDAKFIGIKPENLFRDIKDI